MDAETYDLEQVYDQQISPLVTQILDICKDNKIPVVMSFAYAQDAEKDGVDLCSSGMTWPGRSPRAIVEAIHALKHKIGLGLMALTIIKK